MFDGEVSKRRTFAKATLQTRAEAEGLSAILRDDACEGLECHTDEVRPRVFVFLCILFLFSLFFCWRFFLCFCAFSFSLFFLLAFLYFCVFIFPYFFVGGT